MRGSELFFSSRSELGELCLPVYSLLKLLEAEKENTGSDSNENHGSWKHLDSRAFEFLFVTPWDLLLVPGCSGHGPEPRWCG